MQLPEAFQTQMAHLLGAQEYALLCDALEENPAVSVRLNPFKKTEAFCHLDCGEAVAWSTQGRYLNTRPNFTLNPLFHAGSFYVQEASSMFLEQALRQCGTPQLVLDLCAAPGGKSSLLRSLLPDSAFLVSNEPIKNRANVLMENLTKWGHEGCLVTCNYPYDFRKLGAIFDVIAVDAPCSGEGMFRKDNPALEMWSPNNVAVCAERQREIVETIWPTLKNGGYLIYSTCTYNTCENEENVRYFCSTLGAEVVEIPVEAEWQITGSLLADYPVPVYHFMPHKTKGEGFFLALLRKTENATTPKLIGKTSFKPIAKDWAKRLTAPDLLTFERNEICYAVRCDHAPIVSHLMTQLFPLHTGIPLYERKGNKVIPHHALAMSRLLTQDAYPTFELTQSEALDYLRRQSLTIDAPRGYVVLTYQDTPIGFANNLGSRANNLYPHNWKIRH